MGSVRALAVLLCLLVPLGMLRAETRRAVVIGINKYSDSSTSGRTIDLDGAVNDAQGMIETLRTYHGFKPADIHVLLDAQATRAGILKEIQAHLIDAAKPGDISLLFFAGHGSYQDNASSTELDRRDETIVPVDTNRGVPDITDKQISRLLHRALDRKAQVVAIFDSCHSGSLSRYPVDGKTRYVEPAPASDLERSVKQKEASIEVAPEARGAVIMAATQDQQPAQEKFVKGQPRGRFSSALQQVLNHAASGEPIDFLFLRLRALMQAGGSMQEPVLLATKERRAQTLWGEKADVQRPLPRAAVGRITASVVFLQAGHAIGLGRGAVLRSVESPSAVRLQLTEVLGPSVSKARVSDGNPGSVKAGDLFEIEDFGAPLLEPLRVFIPTEAPAQKELDATLKELTTLSTARYLTWVTDPTEETPTHTILWHRGQWVLRNAQRREAPLGTRPKSEQVRRLVSGHGNKNIHLFLSLPLAAETLARLPFAREGSQGSVERVTDPARADYLLIGRSVRGKLEYTWMLLGTTPRARSGVPVRSSWEPADSSILAELLTDYALRLARVKTWQTLDPPVGKNRFPYALRLQNVDTRELLLPGAQVHDGEIYRPVLVASQPAASAPPQVQPRYLYLFSLDSTGATTLLVPGPGMAVGENLVPDARHRGPLPTIIPIGEKIGVSPPFGTETMILLTSATALPDPSVLIVEPVRRSATVKKPCSHPLACLIFGINEDETRSRFDAPTDWSIDRVIVESVPRF